MKTRANWIVVATLALAIGIAYSPAIDGAFQFDDQTSILENTALRSSQPSDWWNYWPTRGLCYLSLGLDYQLHGLQTRGYHLSNLLLHFGAALAVYALLRLLLQNLWVAAGGALLFALHPLQSQAVAYIVQRATAMYAMFYLLSAYLYMRARQGGTRRWIWWSLSYAAALLAMTSKEPALTLPLGLLLLDSLGKGVRGGRWKMWLPFAPLIAMPLLLAQLGDFQFGNASATLSGETALVSRSEYALTQLDVVARYWKLALLPLGQNLDHDIAWRASFGARELGFALFHFAMLSAAWLLYRRDLRLAAVGIGWYYLCLLPESSVYPIADAMFEHRSYLSLFGLALLLCSLLEPWLQASRATILTATLAIATLFLLGMATARRATLWADPLLLWEDVLHKSPQKARPHMAVGWIASNRGELSKARQHLRRAVELDADYGMAWNNLGLVAQRMGDWTEAERSYSQALRLHPDEAVLYLNRGVARRQLGQRADAAADLRHALELDPRHEERWGSVLAELEAADAP